MIAKGVSGLLAPLATQGAQTADTQLDAQLPASGPPKLQHMRHRPHAFSDHNTTCVSDHMFLALLSRVARLSLG